MSRDYLAALRAEPPPAPAQTTPERPPESEKAGTQGTAITAKSPFDGFGSSQGGRFSEIEGVPVVIAEPVRCADCGHWRSSGVQQRGDCVVHAGATAGLWATSGRACAAYLPADVAEGVKAMAERWQYTPEDLAWALDRAAYDPEGWRRLIEAGLQCRRWPGGEHGQD